MTIFLCIAWSFLAGYAVRCLAQRYRDVKIGKVLDIIITDMEHNGTC